MRGLVVGVAAVVVAAGLASGGWFIGQGFVEARSLDRTVVVKGLSERDVAADTAIFPIRFQVAGNDLGELLAEVELQTAEVMSYLGDGGFADTEITVSAPVVTDKQAQSWSANDVTFRYVAQQAVTVYSQNIAAVIESERGLLALGKKGIVFQREDYNASPQYLFGGLNELKPDMVEEATRNARQVAQKFADDSNSRLGRIKSARQGQFSISDRDSLNPHQKKVRVVSTLEYYLTD